METRAAGSARHNGMTPTPVTPATWHQRTVEETEATLCVITSVDAGTRPRSPIPRFFSSCSKRERFSLRTGQESASGAKKFRAECNHRRGAALACVE
jgi:hypothetical protein